MDGRQQEIGGAQALLQLGSKAAEEDESTSSIPPLSKDSLVTSAQGGESDEESSKHQQPSNINDAVEAAVMRYVGGTLENSGYSSKKQKRKLTNDDYDFNQWTGFLSDNLTQEEFTYTPTNKPKKKKKSKKNRGIDPELDTLGSDHDRMVEEALKDARELAEHDQLVEDAARDLERHDQLLQEDTASIPAHQAQQILAAANAVVQESDSSQATKNKTFDSNKFNHLTSVETLVEEASSQVMSWYNSLEGKASGPRRFSPEEQKAVDHFIAGYCHMNKWNRQDVCNRVWSNDRKKDNFWESLTRILPYRSRSSVYKHVRRQYHVFDIRAQWNKADDELLRKLALTNEGKWKQIGEIMGRMPEDCRDRWRNYVKCGEARSANKWTEQEEEQLKEVVNEILTSETSDNINWTIVSERMKGTRSRIQCRYKWAKLIRREAGMRSSYMSEKTKAWLIGKIQQLNVESIDHITWDYITKAYEKDISREVLPKDKYDWQAIDFQVVFEKLKMGVKDHKRMKFNDLLDKLGERYNLERSTVQPTQEDHELPKSIGKTKKSKHKSRMDNNNFDDPASIATAAVAAVSAGVDEEDAKQQEYSLWR
ncbi:uncharacterized protein SPAPADRAFT_52649 [Spathaspora passalidarum NRRL Y-27907]|uniref:RNA polymerase I termination factor n=1 Tax=Spathaspora passalidarum (strain NRRL Y-27907 / 11-Y1) TaxID=619300 RepID=G3AUM1_SPAPN|nr:uncharacterized protein SPAPADRAFT_52649 [Spathaspora passalidarum NRRL Y-27907]EGW30577.1 hypothetical protein SPAPADRAFT_52649 [Spathaspora passalidarum NRRL Y-27907]